MSNTTELQVGNQKVKIVAGELVGYQVSGHEFMHQKGNPGWRNVDTEMFPVIGPTNEADFKVTTAKGDAIQDQHGLLREMSYSLTEKSDNKAVFTKKYTANKEVLNSKYPNKSTEAKLSWPYNFEFEKSYELKEDELVLTFTITGEEGMPFMLGYHPAFMLHSENAVISTDTNDFSIAEVMEVGSRALHVPDANVIRLKDDRKLQITTEGFKHFMLWTEVPNMVCIEPITFYPYAVAQENIADGFIVLKNKPMHFKVAIKPM
ncbi:aldose 1-epimerase [Maribacter sp. ACAM166]|uniref:aldose 1-epimerase n=1 Tax=Maribacter sp. ACAM166 TaxID=2508996 RepID=UPI0010FD1D7C|nr:aldose 1-epimerase [Maribacter sp. ACAM166]TLP75440.1 aldose 1-epimerase [Maribacter sp. ACAM166]